MVTVVQVESGDARLARLLQLYLHEWSARVAVPIGDDASYPYDELAHYRAREARAAFLFLDAQDGRTPLGFALAMRGGPGLWSVEEFFIIAGARRRGVGRSAAGQVFATHPGSWTLTIRMENPESLRFWRAVVGPADEAVEVGSDGITRTRLTFRR